MRADLGVFDCFVGFSAVAAASNGFYRLYDQLGIPEAFFLSDSPVPKILDILRDNAGNLADLKRDGRDLAELVGKVSPCDG